MSKRIQFGIWKEIREFCTEMYGSFLLEYSRRNEYILEHSQKGESEMAVYGRISTDQDTLC